MHISVRKVAIFVGVPLAAVALAVFLLGWGNGLNQKAHAHVGDADFSITAPGCDSDGTPTAKCQVGVSQSTTVTLNLLTQPADGWAGYDADILFDATLLNYVDGCPNETTDPGPPPVCPDPIPADKFYDSLEQGLWPACAFATGEGGFTAPHPKGGEAKFACADGDGLNQLYTGPLASLAFSCKAKGAALITLVAGAGATDVVDGASVAHFEAADESLTINCVNAPTPTPIPPTPTPPPQPRVQKLPVLQNVFLTRQGDKIPPARCEAGTDVADLNEKLNIPITSADPKHPSTFQQLGGFQFEMRFDDKLVCVSVEAGPAWAALGSNAVCLTTSAKGLLRFGCVTLNKNRGLNASVPQQPLAIVHVRPQEELYSQLRPNQDNGIPVQILNQGCNLTDEQGHVIPIFSCEDADITFRYLEGDVDGPDCDVDVFDAQNVAFRWGAAKGSLLFNSFLDLSPSGQIKGDGRIDIKDLQFVFGRLGSQGTNSKGGNGVCTGAADGSDAWPLQPPVNPKAP